MEPLDYLWAAEYDAWPIRSEDIGKINPVHLPEEAPWERRIKVYLYPGDAGLIWGRRVVHYRNRLPPDSVSYHCFLHYVNEEFTEGLD